MTDPEDLHWTLCRVRDRQKMRLWIVWLAIHSRDVKIQTPNVHNKIRHQKCLSRKAGSASCLPVAHRVKQKHVLLWNQKWSFSIATVFEFECSFLPSCNSRWASFLLSDSVQLLLLRKKKSWKIQFSDWLLLARENLETGNSQSRLCRATSSLYHLRSSVRRSLDLSRGRKLAWQSLWSSTYGG